MHEDIICRGRARGTIPGEERKAIRELFDILATGKDDWRMSVYEKIEAFILEHGNDDPVKLLLSKGKWKDIDVDTAVSTIEGRRRMERKIPSWNGHSLIYPDRLCTEQCSSEPTALLKASIAQRIAGKDFRLADLTGGIGADSWAFSLSGRQILHNEAKPALSEAVRHNFGVLGLNNVSFSSFMVVLDSVPEDDRSRHLDSVLGDFHPDIIFLDPARRSETGKKVFLLEDCSPDVIPLMPSLLRESPEVLMKLSPMADIPMVIGRLGEEVSEVHVVGLDGECKELLLRISRGFKGECTLHVHDGGRELVLPYRSEKESKAAFFSGEDQFLHDTAGGKLFIPGKTLSKAGLFNWISEKWDMKKAAPSAHIYFIPEGKEIPKEASSMGRIFDIAEAVPFSSSVLKSLGKKYPKADVLSKDMPLTSEALARKLGVKSGDGVMMVACPVGFSDASPKGSGRWIFICRGGKAKREPAL